jgi:hypothetical protein
MIKNFENFVVENSNPHKYVDGEIVEKVDSKLFDEITEHVNHEIFAWNKGLDNSSSYSESEAIQDFGERTRFVTSWRIYPDGTLDAVIKLVNGRGIVEDFDISWFEDDDAEEELTGNFLDALDGSVTVKFNPESKRGENKLPDTLAEKVKKFFDKKKGAIGAKSLNII